MKDKNSFIILSQLNSNSKNENHSHSCPNCHSTDFLAGAGLKPGQMSLKCSECKALIGYRDVGKLRRLQKLRGKKRLDSCIKFLADCGITAIDEIVFVLSEVGQMP